MLAVNSRWFSKIEVLTLKKCLALGWPTLINPQRTYYSLNIPFFSISNKVLEKAVRLKSLKVDFDSSNVFSLSSKITEGFFISIIKSGFENLDDPSNALNLAAKSTLEVLEHLYCEKFSLGVFPKPLKD